MEPDVIAWPGPHHAGSPAAGTPRALSPDEVFAGLLSQHYVALVRLTVVLLRDLTTAEAVVQDAFCSDAPAAPAGPGQGTRLPTPSRGRWVKVGATPPRGDGQAPER